MDKGYLKKSYKINKKENVLLSFTLTGSKLKHNNETPILWPPDAKSWLIWKDPDAGKDWGQEEKRTTEDEMAGWHRRLNGHEFEWTPGDGDGEGGLACCGLWSHKESDTNERLNWTKPVANSRFIGKDPGAGKDWGQEEAGVTEDEMTDVWHCLVASSTQRTWVCANSRRCWRTGKPGMLQSMRVSKSLTFISNEQQHDYGSYKLRGFAVQKMRTRTACFFFKNFFLPPFCYW